MMKQIKRFFEDDSGPTAVEYAIMLALIGLAIALAGPNIRDAVLAIFTETATRLTTLLTGV